MKLLTNWDHSPWLTNGAWPVGVARGNVVSRRVFAALRTSVMLLSRRQTARRSQASSDPTFKLAFGFECATNPGPHVLP